MIRNLQVMSKELQFFAFFSIQPVCASGATWTLSFKVFESPSQNESTTLWLGD
jgi:hypothetical protein